MIQTLTEWLTTESPWELMCFLDGWCPESRIVVRDRASRRKYRLWACASARQELHRLQDERFRHAIEVAERFADQQAKQSELDAAHRAVREAHAEMATSEYSRAAAKAAQTARRCLAQSIDTLWDDWQENASEADIVRDLIGIPFRRVVLAPFWLTSAVKAMAQGAYDERSLPSGRLDNWRLAVVADALDDAGCDDVDLLAHLRSHGAHYRGCWALDVILNKEPLTFSE